MISVSEAKDIIRKNSTTLAPITISLKDAVGLILAEDVYASIDIPCFPQSSMDGYAFCFDDWQSSDKLIIKGAVPAGSEKKIPILKNQAVRIFTGAAIPANADTVVMQEKVAVNKEKLTINDSQLIKGSNVRPMGSEIRKGALAMQAYCKLTPAAIGFLAAIGIHEVKVFPTPKVHILITGNELTQPGQTLLHGQVYESNSFALKAVLELLHIHNVSVSFAKDDLLELRKVLEGVLGNCDLLLITGGVSVGDYDYVADTLKFCGVAELFHTVKQKPGKPLYVGKTDHCLVFGLPGNPSSALTCFYEYSLIAIERMKGIKSSSVQEKRLKLTNNYHKRAGLTHFLKANWVDDSVSLLHAQESYRLASYAHANCIVSLEEERTDYTAGDIVDVHILPC